MTTRVDLFADVPGQERAVAELVAAAAAPVHAYLFLGPAGTNKDTAAIAFAAMILCEHGGCGTCATCQRVLTTGHPDLVVVEPVGVAYKVEELRTIGQVALRRPLEAPKTVIIVREAQAVGLHYAAFLKTLEEPPGSTVFILVADDLPRSLQTITSRCVVVRFRALSPDVVAGWLVDRGSEPRAAAAIAEAAAGNLRRASLLVDDPGFLARYERWVSIPTRLDADGATASRLADEVLAGMEEAVDALKRDHERQVAALEAQAAAMGERRVQGLSNLRDDHKREIRRYETVELTAGLGALARCYRDEMVVAAGADDGGRLRRVTEAVTMISALTSTWHRNPRPKLALERLFLDLGALGSAR